MSKMHIVIDHEVCIGMGNCVTCAPGVFEMDDAGYALVVDEAAAPREAVERAAEECPVSAITVTLL